MPDSYSVRLEREAHDPNGSIRPLPRLYRGTCISVRHRDPVRILEALRVQLDAHRAAGTADALVVPGIALLHEEGAMIVPVSWERAVAAGEHRLTDAGLRLVPSPVVLLEPESGSLLVPGPGLYVDDSALDGTGSHNDRPPAPIRTWIVRAGDHPPLATVPPAEVVASVMRRAENAELLGPERALRTLTNAAAGASSLSARSIGPSEVVSAVLRFRNV